MKLNALTGSQGSHFSCAPTRDKPGTSRSGLLGTADSTKNSQPTRHQPQKITGRQSKITTNACMFRSVLAAPLQGRSQRTFYESKPCVLEEKAACC